MQYIYSILQYSRTNPMILLIQLQLKYKKWATAAYNYKIRPTASSPEYNQCKTAQFQSIYMRWQSNPWN